MRFNNSFSLYLLVQLLCIVSISEKLSAQENWQTVDAGLFNFKLPQEPLLYQTPKHDFYALEIDSLLAMQVHVYRDAAIKPNDLLFSEALFLESGDTLRAMARVLLLAVNAEAVDVWTLSTGGLAALQLHLNYNALASDFPMGALLRLYWFKETFYLFILNFAQSDLSRAQIYGNLFFDEINFSL